MGDRWAGRRRGAVLAAAFSLAAVTVGACGGSRPGVLRRPPTATATTAPPASTATTAAATTVTSAPAVTSGTTGTSETTVTRAAVTSTTRFTGPHPTAVTLPPGTDNGARGYIP